MHPLSEIVWFTLTSLIAFIISLSPGSGFTPQIIALVGVALIFIRQKLPQLIIYFLSFIGHLLVFSTGGLDSPLFFLIYFLLFTIAFRHRPSVTLSLALANIILLSQTIISPANILPLASILFIGPLAWFVGRQYMENMELEHTLSVNETDILYWINLKFKTGILKIIDSASDLLSSPSLPHSHKQKAKFIKDSARSLLNSSRRLSSDIDSSSD